MDVMYKLLDRLITTLMTSLLTMIVLVSGLQVILRFSFNSSMTWSLEFVNYVFVWMICLGMGFAVGKKAHIFVDFLIEVFPHNIKRMIRLLNELITTIFMSVIVYYGYVVVAKMFSTGALSPTMRIPTGYIYLAIPIGALIAILYGLRNMVELLQRKAVDDPKNEAKKVLEEIQNSAI